MKNFVILHTGSGKHYAKHVASSIRWIYNKFRKGERVNTILASVNDFEEKVQGLVPSQTTIYARAAYPTLDGWMGRLKHLEDIGFTVVNKVKVLQLTSDKLACSLHLQGRVPHPKILELSKDGINRQVLYDFLNEESKNFILKPLTSMEQGASVVKVYCQNGHPQPVLDAINNVPGSKIVLQEYVPYTAIYRVIVIGGEALPYSFVDRPEWHPDNWKVSVCLNKTTMRFVPNPNPQLLRLAERTQLAVGGEINFVDVFETAPRNFIISEINTACNLRIHEKLAEAVHHPMANIHYRIAKYLVNKEV